MSNHSKVAPNWASFRGLWKLIAIILAILCILAWLFGFHPWSDRCDNSTEYMNKISMLEKENAKIAGLNSTVVDLQAKIKSLKAASSGDNSALTERIAELETKNGIIPGLQAKVKALEAIDINFIQPGDDSALLAKISGLETKNALIPGLQAKIKALEGIDLNFVKPQDNSALLAKISELETKNGLIPGLQAKIKALESIDVNFISSAAVMPPLVKAKLYFTVNSATFPSDSDQSLQRVIEYLKANVGARVSVVGFHDATGSAEWNRQLASNRSEHVRELLLNAGISVDRILLEKPFKTLGTGARKEARRVEVTIVK